MSKYVEESLIIAALESDREEVQRLVGDMLPGERRALLDAIELVEEELEAAPEQPGKGQP
ncbi:Uncharacterised protein (plasmid) [Tsukamurella tyrosinosolvens]|uniref:Uncharacterized protein n=1 Tax=Tsukamurella tyrosinosolvens TaxID=57704 RepID=A0A1H4V065_TSUTY|nr:hypothetical protein [Tsukamurella tyrosinosolvens]KXO91092.1 hypothetical protein AXK58_21930 [Tsukamurella tyrosinosolvens]SEC74190.1 hypothetical protein SAMN04489793_3092 [Tsukamurella tyrosinosolvens]VEH90777.1 Uncharacterised protein [Tsukamurella tyrosinosolvens]